MPIGALDPAVTIRLRQLLAQREAEKELRGLVEPPRPMRPSGLPDVPPPPMVRNLSINATRPALIKALEQIQQIAPQAGVGVHTISTIPGRGLLRDVAAAGIDPGRFASTNILGATEVYDPGRVYLNPNLQEPADTLVHELTHSAGSLSTEGPSKRAEEAWAKLDPRQLDDRAGALNWDLFGQFWPKPKR